MSKRESHSINRLSALQVSMDRKNNTLSHVPVQLGLKNFRLDAHAGEVLLFLTT